MWNRLPFHAALPLLAIVLLLFSCRSSKKVVTDDPSVPASSTAVQTGPSSDAMLVTAVAANRQTAKGLRSRVNIKLQYDSQSASASGQLKMKRDEIIQVTITALGLMEVGRLELTPQQLLVLDRVNKQYLQVAWDEVPELAQAGVDFTSFQALFWDELFVPGISGSPEAADFDVEHESSTLRLTPKASRANTKKVAVNFLVATAKAMISQTNLQPSNGHAGTTFSCNYDDWGAVAGKPFPQQMTLNVTSGGKNYTLRLNSSNLQADESMGQLNTRVGTGYKRVTLQQILKMLAK